MLSESKYRLGSGLTETGGDGAGYKSFTGAANQLSLLYPELAPPLGCVPNPHPLPLEPLTKPSGLCQFSSCAFNTNSPRAGCSPPPGLSSPKPEAPGAQALGSFSVFMSQAVGTQQVPRKCA